MTGPGAPSLQQPPSTSDSYPPPPGGVVHLLLGHALVDEARRALRLVLRVVPSARPSASPIRCAGSRRRNRPGRCCRAVAQGGVAGNLTAVTGLSLLSSDSTKPCECLTNPTTDCGFPRLTERVRNTSLTIIGQRRSRTRAVARGWRRRYGGPT